MNIIDVINVAITVREHYRVAAPDSYPLSIDFYIEQIIQPYTGYKIEVMESSDDTLWTSSNIRGAIHRYDEEKRAVIYVARQRTGPTDRSGVTFCEQRFIVIKEACHLLIDNAETYTTDATALIQQLVFPESETLIDNNEAFQSENYAAVAALELLFPWSDREGKKQQHKAGTMSYFDIANEYKIPERAVAFALMDSTHETLQKHHQSIEKILGSKIS